MKKNNKMSIEIWQIDPTNPEVAKYMFLGTKMLKDIAGLDAPIGNGAYKRVYKGVVKASSLEDVFRIFNDDNRRLSGFTGHSLSVSDLVIVVEDGPVASGIYFCDDFGFKTVEFNP